jgi:PAS domain S-box-containing protein
MDSERAERRVLVVDDEADFVETVEEILSSRGYEVAVAHGASEAQRQLVASSAQVVLLDIRLGRSSGIDLLSTLRAAAPGLVCVMMTAYADVETAVQALTKGAHHYLRKPIDPRDLLATLERCFEKVRLESEKAAAETALRERNEQLAEINARLQQMVRSAQSLASCTRLEELNHRLLAEAARVMAAEGGSLFFRRADAFERVSSLDEDHVPARLALPLPPESVFGVALSTKQPVLVRNIGAAADLRGSGWPGYRDGSLLVFPIEVAERVEALLSLHNKTWPPFTEQDRELGQVMISLNGEILKTQQAAQAVRDSEARYRLLAENVLDVILTLDSALRVSYVSPSIERLTGRSVEHVLEHGLEAIATEASSAAVRPVLTQMLEQAASATAPLARTLDVEVRRDGDPGRAEVTFAVVHGPGGPSLLGVARDVTDRWQAQAEVSRLAQVVEQTADNVIVTDANGVIEYVNPAFERLTGYSREEVVGQTPRLLRSGVHGPALYREMWSTIASGGTWRGRLTNRCKDGRLVVEEGAISPIRDGAGTLVGYVSAQHDVTRQTALEARLAQTQKLESIGRLAGGIAHDFNNILVAVLGFVDLLERGPLGERQHRYVRGIGEAARRAADLTKQILTFSRQGSPERRPLELATVVDEACKLMRAALPAGVELSEGTSSSALVCANATQLHQVVVNLCTNAGLAMRGRGGLLELDVSEVEVDASMTEVCPPLVPGRHARLTVRDTGCGMSPEVQARIFEPFYTTREQNEGTGMGLAVVHGIVADHGGAIAVRSRPAAGSTFEVFLPTVIPGAEPTMPAAVEPAAARRAARVLFVDDDAVQVEIARETLGSLGYRVAGATSGQEALELVRRDPGAFDVVVTDAAMPGMSGDQLAQELAAVRADLPIVLCSGFSERAGELLGQLPMVRGLLAKPYAREELSAAIQRAVHGVAHGKA